jgi:hypothetical protein
MIIVSNWLTDSSRRVDMGFTASEWLSTCSLRIACDQCDSTAGWMLSRLSTPSTIVALHGFGAEQLREIITDSSNLDSLCRFETRFCCNSAFLLSEDVCDSCKKCQQKHALINKAKLVPIIRNERKKVSCLLRKTTGHHGHAVRIRGRRARPFR